MQTSPFAEGKSFLKSLYKPWSCSLTAKILPGQDHTHKKTATAAARTHLPDQLPARGQAASQGQGISVTILMTGHLKSKSKVAKAAYFFAAAEHNSIFFPPEAR